MMLDHCRHADSKFGYDRDPPMSRVYPSVWVCQVILIVVCSAAAKENSRRYICIALFVAYSEGNGVYLDPH